MFLYGKLCDESVLKWCVYTVWDNCQSSRVASKKGTWVWNGLYRSTLRSGLFTTVVSRVIIIIGWPIDIICYSYRIPNIWPNFLFLTLVCVRRTRRVSSLWWTFFYFVAWRIPTPKTNQSTAKRVFSFFSATGFSVCVTWHVLPIIYNNIY